MAKPNNRTSYMSELIKEAHAEDINPTELIYVCSGEVFKITAQHIKNYFIECKVDIDFIRI